MKRILSKGALFLSILSDCNVKNSFTKVKSWVCIKQTPNFVTKYLGVY